MIKTNDVFEKQLSIELRVKFRSIFNSIALDDKHKRRPSADKLSDKFKKPSIPVPLPDRPRITRMTDNALTLWWFPSVPTEPRIPVTYIVEFARIPDGEWIAYRTGSTQHLFKSVFMYFDI